MRPSNDHNLLAFTTKFILRVEILVFCLVPHWLFCGDLICSCLYRGLELIDKGEIALLKNY